MGLVRSVCMGPGALGPAPFLFTLRLWKGRVRVKLREKLRRHDRDQRYHDQLPCQGQPRRAHRVQGGVRRELLRERRERALDRHHERRAEQRRVVRELHNDDDDEQRWARRSRRDRWPAADPTARPTRGNRPADTAHAPRPAARPVPAADAPDRRDTRPVEQDPQRGARLMVTV